MRRDREASEEFPVDENMKWSDNVPWSWKGESLPFSCDCESYSVNSRSEGEEFFRDREIARVLSMSSCVRVRGSLSEL